MPPKKNAKSAEKKEKSPKEVDPNKVTETDKTIYEIRLASLDEKIKRLRDNVAESEEKKGMAEEKIEELRTNKKKVITFLSDQLKRKTEELQDLEEKLEGSKQEFDLEVADLNKGLTDQKANFESEKHQVEEDIREIKEEIASLIHFQQVKDQIEAEEVILKEKVEQQRTDYEEKLRVLQEREKADFVRMKKDMIQRVNIAATDFRKSSDQQVPPTIKRAIRENQQVQSALKKMEINCKEINQESEAHQQKYNEITEKKNSLYNSELHLAHQSHAKSFIIAKLKAKCKEANEELEVLELREAEIDEKQNYLRGLKEKIENNSTAMVELESEMNKLIESKNEKINIIELENKKISKMKHILAKCGADILDHSHITRPTINELMSYFVVEMEISDAILSRPINSIENLNIFDSTSTL